MASQDVQAILAALQGASQHATPIPPERQYSRPHTAAQQQPQTTVTATPPAPIPGMPGMPAPAYSGVVPTPPPAQQSSYPPYPQPAASGSIDLNAIKPVGQGSVNFQDALAKVQGFAAGRGIPPPSSAGPPPPRQDPRLAGRPPMDRSRSRSPPRNYSNPYRDERRDDPRRQNGYGRERSRSPSRQERPTYASTRDRDYGRDDPDSEVISIDSNLVGLVIGRGGDNLKRIERETGARIQFITGPQHNGPQRDCRLSGEVHHRRDAKNMIWRILDENGGHAGAMRTDQGPPSRQGSQSGMSKQMVNQPKLREGENSVQIMVPDKTVGLIIGRGGETIRELQEKSACHINIVGENKSVNGFRPVNLIGSEAAANLARTLILEIVDSDTRDQQSRSSAPQQQDRRPPMGGMGGGASDKITEMIHVPSEAVGMIIGKGGQTIKEMQNDTGCKINVQQASGRDIERPIELVGDRGSIERAKTALWDKVEQVREKNSGGGGRPSRSNDQYGGGNQYGGSSYGQQSSYGQPGPAQSAPAGGDDPYAQYGGYAAYTAMWQQYLQSQQGAGAPAPRPQ